MRRITDGTGGLALLLRLNQDRLVHGGALLLALLAGGWLGAPALG